ncbi:DUF3169 family protein [Novisyntrophococcus fermenticellae]|uniref:DUF3169 family protein n=1 Tax=Novisyntrophococcus fermenticellae TaxID=2068655 RepID=UPI001E5C5637|nr:DUF3169 family protein [Novisyntrophococcus fermenticellae]
MNRTKKEGKGFSAMGGKLLLGAVIGGIIGYMFGDSDSAAVEETANYLLDMTVKAYRPVMMILTLCMLLLNLLFFLKLRFCVLQAEVCRDEEKSDLLDDKIDRISTLSLSGNGVFYILLFFNYVLSYSRGERTDIMNVLLFIVPVLIYPVFYILIVNLLKRHDPSKKGVPGSMRFQKDWMESCDEAEKMRTFRVSYQTNIASCYIISIGFCTTAILALLFPVGVFALFITALMWLAQTIINGYYNIKSQKEKMM